ncbi:MAG TPA: SpoIID/LytB domain-containing protein, partial [Candidatus Acidoferrales bacterium]|nr:SpoIID/LytB domain-containing protein [Candidatus Acidoferrales bacterium]
MRRGHFLGTLGGFALGARLAAQPARAALSDVAGTVRVRLFSSIGVSKLEIGGVSIDGLGGTVTRDGVTSPFGDQVLELTGSPALFISATSAAGQTTTRTYPGTLYVALRQGEILAVNVVDVEAYVASVMSAEVSPGWPIEALRAQAIAVRTYAAHAARSNAGREYDVRDDTTSQVYPGIDSVAPTLTGAANDTRGQIVSFGGAPATVFYSSSCGGHTASSEELTGLPAPSYLNGVADTDGKGTAYCSISPYFRWTNTVANDAMARVIGVPPNELTSVQVTERWPDGRVKSVVASGSILSITLTGRDFYQRALALLGYKVIPSALFDIDRTGSDFTIVGHGV